MSLRAVYLDLDGTLLGPGGSLLRDAGGGFTLLGARALEACARAGAEVVLSSGRRRRQLHEDARILGAGSYVFEAGSGFVLDGEVGWLTDERHAGIAASGAPDLLLEHFAGGLAVHAPWHEGREVTHLFKGEVDVAEANALLADRGLGHLRLLDNGVAKHLLPRDVSKARGVARHMRARGYTREEVIAVGDSREDLECAEAVGTFWLVANGAAAAAHGSSLRVPLTRTPNARVTEAAFGAGVYEAILTTLAERR